MSISMGIDIGSTTAKVVITEDDKILFQCYERHFSQVRQKTLEIIYHDFTQIIELHKPDAVAIEKLFFTTNQKTAIDVAQARGIILLVASLHGVPCFEYTPLQVKQAVVGYGKAVKTQVQEMTKQLLNLRAVPKPDDVADALAIAICHAHTAPSLMNQKRLAKQWKAAGK